MEEHHVIAFPMEPKGIDPGLDADPQVPERLGVGGGGRKDVVGGVERSARVEEMCWGEGFEVIRVVAAGGKWSL